MGKMETEKKKARFRHPTNHEENGSKKQIIQIRTETNPSVIGSDGSKIQQYKIEVIVDSHASESNESKPGV